MITTKYQKEISKKIFCDRVRDLHGHLLTASIPGTLLCATILFLGLYNSENTFLMMSWYFSVIVISLLRFALLKWYERDSKRASLHLKMFIMMTVLSAITWGVAGSVLMSKYNVLTSVLIIIVIAGVTAGACQSLKASQAANALFMLVSIVPLALWLLMQKERVYIYVGVSMVGYLAFMLIIAHKNYNQIVNVLQLRYENEFLLNELASKHSLLEQAKEKLDYLAGHDFLTGANNRHSLNARFNNLLTAAKKDKFEFCVMYIDVDHFKTINDRYGHETGDHLLVEVSKQFRKYLHAQDIVVRMGGDEFVILMWDKRVKNRAEQFSRHILEKLRTPVILNGNSIVFSISIGCSLFPEDGDKEKVLLDKADQALYQAKTQGRNRYEFYKEKVATEL